MSNESDSQLSGKEEAAECDERITRGLRAIVLLHRGFEQGARKVGVSIPQYRMLLFLRHGARRAGELAASAAVQRPTLTALVAGMEKEEWIRRVDVEGDRRGVALELTSKGRDAIEKLEAKLGGIVDAMSSEGDRVSILDSLDGMADILKVQVENRIRDYRGR